MPASTHKERVRRRHRLLELLEDGLAGTQSEIVDTLAGEGFRATQATISRDLEEVGAVRVRDGARFVYTLPESNGPPAGFGRRVIGELVRDVTSSANLVVIHTFPGMAPTVGAVLDQIEVDGVLGTVAGDDTVLIVAAEAVGGATVARSIGELSEAG